MIQVSLSSDAALQGLSRQLMLLTERNISYATGRAMAGTIRRTEKDLKANMASTSGPIDRGATRWTVGGTYTVRPTPTNLTAEVGIRNDTPRAAGRYISVLVAGGKPRTKGVDLKASSLVGQRGLRIVPTPGQRLDSKGNVSRAAFNKALASASYIRDGRMYNRGSGRFFIIPIRGASGRMGIFERTGKPGRGRYGSFVGTNMRFTLEPQPKRRAATYDLLGDLQASAALYWPGQIRAEIQSELRRAGFR